MEDAYSRDSSPPVKTLYRVGPRGFCAGVVRAIDTVEAALQLYKPPVYVLHAIVHNQYVLEDLAAKGAIFVESVNEVPYRGTVVFSAHGVPPSIREQAKVRGLHAIDATCPLVAKVHAEAVRFARMGYTILLIGDREHDEVRGTLGHADSAVRVVSTLSEAATVSVEDPKRVAYLTQTTVGQRDAAEIIDCLARRFPGIQGPPTSDICYATQNRQDAVESTIAAFGVELVLVIGSSTSANSRRLVEIAQAMKVPSHLIEDAEAIQPEWLEPVLRVALTAGASAPEHLVERAVTRLNVLGFSNLQDVTFVEEHVHFSLPNQLILVDSIQAFHKTA